jgi:hypothetical protein
MKACVLLRFGIAALRFLGFNVGACVHDVTPLLVLAMTCVLQAAGCQLFPNNWFASSPAKTYTKVRVYFNLWSVLLCATLSACSCSTDPDTQIFATLCCDAVLLTSN